MPKIIGIQVKGVGPVNSPLLEHDGKRIMKAIKINDTSLKTGNVRKVANSFLIDPLNVTIKNPEWDVRLNELVGIVGRVFGCQTDIGVKN